MHGWIPAGAIVEYTGKDNPFAVCSCINRNSIILKNTFS